jgi:hypothetical protein
MKDLDEMLALLEQKRLCFLSYEKEMEAVPILPAEELEPCVDRGGLILEQAAALDTRLDRLLSLNEPAARQAISHDCDRQLLTPELGQLYDAALKVKTVAYRIRQNESVIRERIEIEREKALERLRELNHRPEAVAGKYRRSVETGVNRPYPASEGTEA